MPDATRATISATEVSALFDVNPYVTRWMLYRRFAYGEQPIVSADSRMDWGKRLEPLILQFAAEELKLEIRPNAGPEGKQVYVSNGPLGCTRDAEIICPDRGPGAFEVKSVFDYPIWMENWGGGNTIPKHIELQVQAQMKVGDGTTSYRWGVIAVWVCGEVLYFNREPLPKLWEAMDREIAAFFAMVKGRNEPSPIGDEIEMPLLAEVFPVREESVLDLRNDPQAMKLAEDVRMLKYHSTQHSGHEKGAKTIKAKLRGIMKDYETLLLPKGINVKQKRVQRAAYSVDASEYVTIKPYVPDNIGTDL